eukprot:8999974-Pyramimonas_sp.AAC.1
MERVVPGRSGSPRNGRGARQHPLDPPALSGSPSVQGQPSSHFHWNLPLPRPLGDNPPLAPPP